MEILITGGAGFVGANLAVYLAGRGHKVTALDNLSRRGSELNLPRLEAAGVKFEKGSVLSLHHDRFNGLDVVVHCAGQTSAVAGMENPDTDFLQNTEAIWYLLNECLYYDWRQYQTGLIYFSTNKVYPATAINRMPRYERETRWEWSGDLRISEETEIDGNDHSLYGATKLAGELLAREMSSAFDFPCIVNRCSCLAGPWQWGCAEQGWVAWWMIAFALGLPLQYIGWGGKQVRDVLFIGDLCRLVEQQIARIGEFRGEVFNVGGGPECTLSPQELTAWCEKSPQTLRSTQTMGFLAEVLAGEGLSTPRREIPVTEITMIKKPRRADHCIYISDIRKVCQTFDWQPEIGLDQGLGEIAAWVAAHRQDLASLYGEFREHPQ